MKQYTKWIRTGDLVPFGSRWLDSAVVADESKPLKPRFQADLWEIREGGIAEDMLWYHDGRVWSVERRPQVKA